MEGKYILETEHQMTAAEAAETILKLGASRPHIKVSLGDFSGFSPADIAREVLATATSFGEATRTLRHQGIDLNPTHTHIIRRRRP